MIKKIVTLVLSFVSLTASAQVTVNVQLPGGGMIQKDQLWNLVIVNNNNATVEALVSLDIQDALTGQTVLSAVGRGFMLGKGVKVISSKDVQPVQYNYIAAELSGTYIPLGNYIACYRVSKNDVKGPEPVGDECVRLNITPLSPPLLNTPADRSVLEPGYPQFTWTPPAPVDMFSNLNYDLVIAEVQDGQSPAEAVLYNTPVYSTGNLKTVFLNYPSTFSKLKPGQQYAWQVTARNGLNYAAQTEVWSFTIKSADPVKPTIYSSGYIQLKDKAEPTGISYSSSSEELLVKYYSFDAEHEAVIRFLSADGKVIKEIKQKISYGDNFLKFKLGNPFEKNTVYSIELPDKQQKIHSAKFNIQ